jgi:alpha-methylacyl-CoA racemase
MTLPLEDLRVLDLSRLLPGGYCTLILADLGADVIKIEEPGRGDYLRSLPPYTSTGESGMYRALNRGKRSVALNLKCPGGVDVLRRLAGTADVLVESFRPGVLDRLGVGYPQLRAVNPRLVYAAISGYGATGPYVDKAGHDINYLAYAGALSFNGTAASGPIVPGLQIGDVAGGGWQALAAILVALRVRERTGAGQFCDVSMTDGVLSALSIAAGAFAATGVPPRPGQEWLNGGYACYGVYTCADGRALAVGALEPPFFRALLEVLGLPELMPRHTDRVAQPALRRALEVAFATRSRDEWVAAFAGRDACVAPALDLSEAFADANARARGMVVDTTLADGSGFPTVGVVPRLADTPGRLGGPPPELGADTESVLAGIGMTTEQVAALRAEGVV